MVEEEIKIYEKSVLPVPVGNVMARDFSGEEIYEINGYFQNNIPFSVLNQLFPLTEVPNNKAKIYTACYRITYAAMNYVSDETTKLKLIKLLDENKSIYEELFHCLINSDTKVNFIKLKYSRNILRVFDDTVKNETINKFINIFLVFAERQKMVDINKVTGINLDAEDGVKVYNDIVSTLQPKDNLE